MLEHRAEIYAALAARLKTGTTARWLEALLAHIHGDRQWARVAPPLSAFPAGDLGAVVAGYDAVRAKQVA